EAFRRAARQGLHAALAYLEQRCPVRPEVGRRKAAQEGSWTTSSVRRLLQSRTYLGETSAEKVLANGEDAVNRKAHKALTTLEDWTAAEVRCQARARRDNGEYPLTGTAVCAECGQGLHGQRQAIHGRTYPRYRCSNKACGGGSSILARGSFPDGTPRGLED